MDRRRNEQRNVVSLILKLRIFVAVQDLIISFYMQKFSLFSAPLLTDSAPLYVCSGDGTVFIPPISFPPSVLLSSLDKKWVLLQLLQWILCVLSFSYISPI